MPEANGKASNTVIGLYDTKEAATKRYESMMNKDTAHIMYSVEFREVDAAD
jgi:hypothetical protein